MDAFLVSQVTFNFAISASLGIFLTLLESLNIIAFQLMI